MKRIETDRLVLRPWRMTDVDDMYEYAKDPAIGPNAGWEPHASPEVTTQILQKFIEQDDTWAIELQESGKVIGSIGLHEDRRREGIHARMLGYVLSQDYWGRGLMTEAAGAAIRYAFEELGVDILSVIHYTFNDRSRRVIEKCGFQYEGTIRMAGKLFNGTIVDDRCYSILREEYGELKGSLLRAAWQ